MAWDVSADPARFDEAIAWFRARFPITDELLAALGEYAGERAWTVAGVAELDAVLALHDSIAKALEEGTSLDEWKASAREILKDTWTDPSSARLETIFRTNTQTAYGRGRWVQMKQVADTRPYWMFDAVMDDRTTDICETANGTMLPQDDGFWDDNYPPLHMNCRSSVRSLTEEQAGRRGISDGAPDTNPADGFGKSPDADEWQPDPNDYPDDLWAVFEAKQKA